MHHIHNDFGYVSASRKICARVKSALCSVGNIFRRRASVKGKRLDTTGFEACKLYSAA